MEFEPLEPPPKASKVWAKRAAFAVGVFVVLGLFTSVVRGFMTTTEKPRKMVQEVVLLRPPPPPPPPKPEEKPPEPEIKKEEVKLEEKTPDPPPDNEPPPALKSLGVDAEGSGPGDNFGLLANKGGTDIINTLGREEGPGGNGSGQLPEIKPEPIKDSGTRISEKKSFKWYTTRLQGELQDALARNEKLQGAAFRISVRLWLDSKGGVSRVELVDSTGDAGTDSKITSALSSLTQIAEAPPADMPQPMRIRITSRL